MAKLTVNLPYANGTVTPTGAVKFAHFHSVEKCARRAAKAGKRLGGCVVFKRVLVDKTKGSNKVLGEGKCYAVCRSMSDTKPRVAKTRSEAKAYAAEKRGSLVFLVTTVA